MAIRARSNPDTAAQVLDSAEHFVQERGYNGFSYADIAAALGVTKAALHYHFATKADLGTALISRYRNRFEAALGAIDRQQTGALTKLRAYADLYRDVLQAKHMCLCGMLAAEFETLPAAMQASVQQFFEENESWLARILEEGASEGSVRYPGRPRAAASMIIGSLEGAVLIARPYNAVERFDAMVDQLLGLFDSELSSPAQPS